MLRSDLFTYSPRCNRHLLKLGQDIKKSLVDEDIIAYQFGTVGVRYAEC